MRQSKNKKGVSLPIVRSYYVEMYEDVFRKLYQSKTDEEKKRVIVTSLHNFEDLSWNGLAEQVEKRTEKADRYLRWMQGTGILDCESFRKGFVFTLKKAKT
jgi:hypothetical protein